MNNQQCKISSFYKKDFNFVDYLIFNLFICCRLLEQHQTASLMHFRRISDYIELGPGIWYHPHETAIEFLDGFDERCSNDVGPVRTHFRYTRAYFTM